jgi:hypothetical protein
MAAPSSLAVLCSSRTLRPTLPPKQSSDYQVEFGGEIRLACGSGPGIGTYHQQATFRKRPEIPAGQMSQLPPDPVAHDSAAHSAANHEADPGRLIVARPVEQMRREQLPSRAAAATDRRGEVRAPPHPRRGGEHRRSPATARAGCVVDGPSTILYRGRWPIDHNPPIPAARRRAPGDAERAQVRH